MSTNNHRDVGEFHRQFGLTNTLDTHAGPTEYDTHSASMMKFRMVLIREEVKELSEALKNHDLAEVADALVDLVYVAHGMAQTLGLPWDELWDDVQRANMSKVRAAEDGSDSKRGSGFDVVKPEGWVPPNGAEILAKYGFEL